jgi:hypothetical protein
MKQLLEDLAFYEAELDSAVEFDDLRGYYIFKDKINSIKKQIEIKTMEELDAKLSFNFNVLIDNLGIEVTDSMMKPITKVAIKLAKDYAAHCIQEQRYLCVDRAYVDKQSILDTPLYNGENYGQ